MENNSSMMMNNSVLYRCSQKYYDKQLLNYDIGAGQLLFLLLIYENEGISMNALAEKGCYDKGTITKGIQKLEEQGYVKSIGNPEDKRVRCLYTTAACEALIGEIYLIRRAWWERLTKDMSQEEVEIFLKMQTKMSDNARAFGDADDHIIKLFGLQKLTLLDYPGNMASTLFTGGCNFRCPFCHNADLVFLPENTAELKMKDVIAFLKKRVGILEGICISGGEPLMQEGLEPFLREVKQMGYRIKLDTNGTYPQRLRQLVEAGLVDYVAMDIKNAPNRYGESIGITNYDLTPIQASIDYLLSDVIPYEFRTTIVKEFHNEQDMREIGAWIQGAKAYYLQGFVDSARVIQSGLHAHDDAVMKTYCELLKPYVQHVETRGI